jgi:probable F420-dependent oxidoreductase
MRYPPSQFPVGGGNWEERLESEDFQTIAQTVERLGFGAISVPEHIVMPRELVGAMGSHWPDAFTVMSFIAGATRRIRVNSSVIVLPYHHPVVLAKAVSTLDVMSGGRVTVTFGAGMARGEFKALGIPFTQRGRIVDEYLDVLKVLWVSEDPQYHGQFIDFDDIAFEPKPIQKPHPPIWIGGSSMAALRRAARVGDGWSPAGSQGGRGPWLNTLSDLPLFLEEARKVPGFVEREGDFDIAMPVTSARFGPNHESLPDVDRAPRSVQHLIDLIGTMEEAGVTWTSIPRLDGATPSSLPAYLEGLEWASREVIGKFR